MLTDAKQPAKSTVRRRSVNATTNKHWSDSQKIEAVTTYLALGNLVLTSNVLKIPEMTLRGWKQKDWWKQIEDELAVQEDLQLSARLKRTLESSMDVISDRMQNGDYAFVNGELRRKPVSMKDAHRVAMDYIDKREHLANKTPTSVALEAVDERLKKLAEKFEQIANNRHTIEVTDVIIGEEEYVDTDSTPTS